MPQLCYASHSLNELLFLHVTTLILYTVITTHLNNFNSAISFVFKESGYRLNAEGGLVCLSTWKCNTHTHTHTHTCLRKYVMQIWLQIHHTNKIA